MDQWNLMMQKINKLNRFVKKIMILFAGSLLVEVVEIDSLGRILVPFGCFFKYYKKEVFFHRR
jgi:MraZ protein